jgi:hypothetical protein
MADTDHPKALLYVLLLVVAGVLVAAWKLGWFSTIERAIKNSAPAHKSASQSSDD